MMNLHRNNNKEMWQLQRKFDTIVTNIYARPITYDVDDECAMQKPSQRVMKICGNIDENISQNQTYNADVVCATKIRGKL
jgi:hypothetical protein